MGSVWKRRINDEFTSDAVVLVGKREEVGLFGLEGKTRVRRRRGGDALAGC